MSDIPAELSLDVSAALAAIGQIDTALQDAAANFQASIGTAVSSLDVPPVDVPVEFDTTGADQIDATIQEAAGGVVVPVEADTSKAQDEISSLEAEPVVVEVDADTSAAQDSISSLGAATQATGHDFEQFGEQARAGFEGAAAGITGNIRGMTGALKGFGPEVAGAAVAVGTLAEVGHVFFENALEAVAAQQRFNQTLGAAAPIVEHIDIGGLNVSLHELASGLGSTTEGLEQASASIFQLGQSAGAPTENIAETTKQIDALAARAVALNPALGQVGDVAQRMLTGLARGGRFASQFNLSLTQTQITAEALRENVGKTADQLTLYDKAAAGAALATRQLGDSLARDIARGSENVAIQFARVKESFHETLEETGKPLLGPTLDLLKDAEPILASVAEAFGSLLQVVIPFADALTQILVPALESVTPLLDLVGKSAGFLGKAFEISLLPVTGPLKLIEGGVHAVQSAFEDGGKAAEDGGEKIAAALVAAHDTLSGLFAAADTGFALGDAFSSIVDEIQPLTAAEGLLKSQTVALALGLEAGTASAQDFRRVFAGSGLDVGAFTDSVKAVIAERNRLTASFQQGLPQIGDAFTVEAAKVSAGAKQIDRSFQDLIDASDALRDRFTQNIPSIGDAFAQGVKPEDLRDAQNTLEAFIQGVEGVSKSAADAAQAVIDKAQVEGGTGLAGFLQKLREQTAEIAQFQGTLAALRGRGASDLAATFAERGLESAAVAAEAAGLSDTDLAAAEATVEKAKGVRNDAVKNMGLFADELVATFGPKGAEAGQVFGEGLVTNLSDPRIVEQARAAAAAIANATTEGAASGVKAQPQTLAGFLDNLKSQSADIQKFQDNLDTIAANGGQVLADTLRQQGITAANAAAQAAALAPAQLQAAEDAVRVAQTVLANAEDDNQAAANRLEQFMADTAAGASGAFKLHFLLDVEDEIDRVGEAILARSNTLAADAGSLGVTVGDAYATAFADKARQVLLDSPIGFLFSAGQTAPPAVALTLPPGGVANVQAGFGTGTSPALDTSAPSVVIEQLNVTPPRDSTADEQADAISESLSWRIRGAR